MQELERLMDLARPHLEKKRRFRQKMYNRGFILHELHEPALFAPQPLQHHRVNGMNADEVRTRARRPLTSPTSPASRCPSPSSTTMRAASSSTSRKTGNLYNSKPRPRRHDLPLRQRKTKTASPTSSRRFRGERLRTPTPRRSPSTLTDDPFEALELQNTLQCKYTNGAPSCTST